MSVLADTSGILVLLDSDHKRYEEFASIWDKEEIIVPQAIFAEVDYMGTKYVGDHVVRKFFEDVLAGKYTYMTGDQTDLSRAVEIMNQYPDVPLGIVDSSVMALAERHQIRRILTLDRKHFSLVKPKGFEFFELLP
jgi:uncharacterized protein